MQASRSWLPGDRLHLQHGPIDLVIGAEGTATALQAAHAEAWQTFRGLLAELVLDLPPLRRPVRPGAEPPLRHAVARRMWLACAPHAASGSFITPMAAVAGAVAEHMLRSYQRRGITRAWVNNGGDIALHLTPGTQLNVGLFADLARLDARQLKHGLALDGHFTISAAMPVRGIATSGWRGRSFSLGIADSVTVLATTASAADAAATMVANAVDLPGHPGIVRRPASALKDHSELGELPVTVDVPRLSAEERHAALQAGLQRAQDLRARGLITAAALVCQGELMHTDLPDLVPRSDPRSPARTHAPCAEAMP